MVMENQEMVMEKYLVYGNPEIVCVWGGGGLYYSL